MSEMDYRSEILIVEDNPCIVELMSLVIDAEPYWKVTPAISGRDALEAWEMGNFDLILMDLRMPMMDGFEVVRRIRALEKELGRERTPIIACSALADEESRRACAEAGFDDFVSKPIRIKKVLNTFYRYIPGIGSPEKSEMADSRSA